ncbi:TMEM165/GDT1 family protein [uncultured Desulfobacter sp.]|uniref:TMEM165/GDT1 family protein n=1 Tax=uncultured Desulfobacter sp. TaxID=240139 RepID=UPI002AAB389B|nr:TMEM165/GDT1 family protein [uncultured Desulfobacter sp.]
MDLKLIISTFVLIFLAELGDKTQLTALAASAGCNKPLSVLLGASLALVFSSVLAIAIGSLIGGNFPIKYVKLTAGILFIVFGILYIKDAFVPEKTKAKQLAASANFLEESAIRAAKAFEQQELNMLQSARRLIREPGCLSVIDDIILEDKDHLKSLSRINDTDEILTEEEKTRFAPMVEEYVYRDKDFLLFQDLYDRQLVMADFYRLMSGKSKLEPVKQAFTILYQEERSHSVKIRSLFAKKIG